MHIVEYSNFFILFGMLFFSAIDGQNVTSLCAVEILVFKSGIITFLGWILVGLPWDAGLLTVHGGAALRSRAGWWCADRLLRRRESGPLTVYGVV